MSTKKTYLLDLSRDELAAYFESIGEKPYRGRQVYNWLYRKFAGSFEEMTDLPAALIPKLEESADINRLILDQEQSSAETGARKFLFRMHDGNMIESVLMPDSDRRTLCISSQAGCALNCSFCATGMMGFKRHLSPGEIVDQFLTATRITGKKPTNIVFMGMGEPFHNYDNVLKAAYLMSEDNGPGIGTRHITISTAGLGKEIQRYFEEGHKFKLAVSLNAALEDTRQKIMPISKKYPIAELARIIKKYHRKRARPVTFEYVLMSGVNDSDKEIGELIRLAKNLPVKINLIPFNPVGDNFGRPQIEHIDSIFQRIRKSGLQVNVRWSKGTDIDAACGQLYANTCGK
ncbi:23S rRNA (adenine(2503)-C(2))-methyltransferase RlmN [candidate division KSB1 bacterium]